MSEPRIIALWLTGAIAVIGMGALCWCGIQRIPLDMVLLMVISNITVAAVSSFTTLLTGRTVAQLNQNSEVRNQPQTQTAALQEGT